MTHDESPDELRAYYRIERKEREIVASSRWNNLADNALGGLVVLMVFVIARGSVYACRGILESDARSSTDCGAVAWVVEVEHGVIGSGIELVAVDDTEL